MRRQEEYRPSAELPGGLKNRDHGKVFLLTEMPAMRAEKWAARFFIAIAHSGVAVPDELESLGMVGVMLLGFTALKSARWDDIEPLMDEMIECVEIVEPAITRRITPDDIAEIHTMFVMRRKIVELHAGFTFADVARMWNPASANSQTASSTTRTSPASAEP